jgi:hypothetical protein
MHRVWILAELFFTQRRRGEEERIEDIFALCGVKLARETVRLLFVAG